MNEPHWQFASTGGGPDDGISNALIEHFTGNIDYYLAREVIQNSIDARNERLKPVRVVFDLDFVSKSELAVLDNLENIFNLCKDYWQDDEKTQKFLDSALEQFAKDKIPVLKISDYNTKGLWGSDDDKKGPWYNLVKSRGASIKEAGAGGFFGIGKGAPFASSKLRTVFYSTISEKDAQTRFIGLAELISYQEENIVRRGLGSYGYDHQRTIMKAVDVPSLFRRREKGLDIFIMGYDYQNNWGDNLIKSILRNFWYAIEVQDLEVEIQNQLISRNNLLELLTTHFLNEPHRDYVEPVGNPLQYYLAFTKHERLFEECLPILGKVRFYFRRIEDHLNHTAMLRASHMVIYSKNFNFPSPYVGVFVCDDENGNEVLRLMEPPAHDRWDPERNKNDGRKAMDTLTDWIRKCLKELKEIRKGEILEIPDLYKYLPYDEENEALGEKSPISEIDEGISEAEKEIQKIEQFQVGSVVEPYTVSVLNKESHGYGGRGKVVRKGNKKIQKPGTARGGESGKISAIEPDKLSARIFCATKGSQLQSYTIIINSKIECKCNLKLFAVGEEGSEKFEIKSFKDSRGINCHVNNNTIHKFPLEKDKLITLWIESSSKLKYALNLEAYEL